MATIDIREVEKKIKVFLPVFIEHTGGSHWAMFVGLHRPVSKDFNEDGFAWDAIMGPFFYTGWGDDGRMTFEGETDECSVGLDDQGQSGYTEFTEDDTVDTIVAKIVAVASASAVAHS